MRVVNDGRRGEQGFTLTELLAVMSILGILAGLVAGAVAFVGGEAQGKRLVGDTNTIGKSADAFFNAAFPQTYPVVSLDATADFLEPSTDLGVRLIDFDAPLPQDPNKSFVPTFLKEIRDSAGLVIWRIDTNTSNVFFARDGATLVRPSESRLDVTADDQTPSAASDYTIEPGMRKNEAGIETLEVNIPAGYAIGGQSAVEDTVIGSLTITFSSDNPWNAGQAIIVTADLVATGAANEWALVVDYATSDSAGEHPKDGAERTHTVSIVPSSVDVPGKLTLVMDRVTVVSQGGTLPDLETEDIEENEATETWELVVFGHPFVDAVEDTSVNIITNPSVAAVYRWLAKEQTTIDVDAFFDTVAGSQAVVIKSGL